MAAPLQVKKGACRVLGAESSPGRALEAAVQLDAALVRVFVRVVCVATEPLETPWMTTRYLALDAFWIPDDGFQIFSRLYVGLSELTPVHLLECLSLLSGSGWSHRDVLSSPRQLFRSWPALLSGCMLFLSPGSASRARARFVGGEHSKGVVEPPSRKLSPCPSGFRRSCHRPTAFFRVRGPPRTRR